MIFLSRSLQWGGRTSAGGFHIWNPAALKTVKPRGQKYRESQQRHRTIEVRRADRASRRPESDATGQPDPWRPQSRTSLSVIVSPIARMVPPRVRRASATRWGRERTPRKKSLLYAPRFHALAWRARIS